MVNTKTNRILKQIKQQQYEPKTPIADEMFIPNHSGISTHPEFQNYSDTTYLRLDGTNCNLISAEICFPYSIDVGGAQDTPFITFGDSDTGFGSSGPGNIVGYINGTEKFSMGANSIAFPANYVVSLSTTGADMKFDSSSGVMIFESPANLKLYAPDESIIMESTELDGTPGFLKIDSIGRISQQGTIDISSNTNLAVSSPITLTGDTVGFDASANFTWTGTHNFQNDVWFSSSGTGLPYGSMYMKDATQTINLVQNSYVTISGYTEGLLNNVTTLGTPKNSFNVGKTGVYKIDWAISADPATVCEVKFAIFLNGVEQSDGSAMRKFGTSGDIGSTSGTGLIDVTNTSHDIDIRAKNITNSNDIDIIDMNFNIVQVGGT